MFRTDKKNFPERIFATVTNRWESVRCYRSTDGEKLFSSNAAKRTSEEFSRTFKKLVCFNQSKKVYKFNFAKASAAASLFTEVRRTFSHFSLAAYPQELFTFKLLFKSIR